MLWRAEILADALSRQCRYVRLCEESGKHEWRTKAFARQQAIKWA